MKRIKIAGKARDKVATKIFKSVSGGVISDIDEYRFRLWFKLDNTFTEILETSVWRSQWRSEMF